MSSSTLRPRLIIHGGAGNITRKNLSPHAWEVYSSTLLAIHRSTSALLTRGATALDAATHAVALFEDSPLFNCGKGAVSDPVSCLRYPVEMCIQVFTRDGTIELEASVSKTIFNLLRLGVHQSVHYISACRIHGYLHPALYNEFQILFNGVNAE